MHGPQKPVDLLNIILNMIYMCLYVFSDVRFSCVLHTRLCKLGVHCLHFTRFGISDAKIMQGEISVALQAVVLCSVKHESTLLSLCEDCKVRTFLLLTLVKFFPLCRQNE